MNQHTGLDDRIRLTARIVAKQEADRATRRALKRLGLADALAYRTPIEREMLAVLSDRVRRSERDPIARV